MNSEKAPQQFWENLYEKMNGRNSKLSSWYISNRTVKALMRPLVKPHHQVLEIGSAPGMWLAWIHKNCFAHVSGIDYSEVGIATQKKLFTQQRIIGNSWCEDIFSCRLPENSFDVVYSLGVIEHYDDPSSLIEAHLRLTKPGGLVVIAIPNYSGIHLALQSFFDSENLEIHNLNLMSKAALERCTPKAGITDQRVFPFGKFNPSLINLNNRLPLILSWPLFHAATLISHLIPANLHGFHCMWVMSFRKAMT